MKRVSKRHTPLTFQINKNKRGEIWGSLVSRESRNRGIGEILDRDR